MSWNVRRRLMYEATRLPMLPSFRISCAFRRNLHPQAVRGADMGRLFGTDGVRGVANSELTAELAFELGRAGATVLAQTSDRHRPVILGRDTRLSGTMLESAMVAGITSVGRD